MPLPSKATSVLSLISPAVRVFLLLVLLWGAATAAAAFAPTSRTLDEFRAAAAAGHIDEVIYEPSGDALSKLRWSEGPLLWHEVDSTFDERYPGGRYTRGQLREDLAENLSPVETYGTDDNGKLFPDWPFARPGGAGLWWVGAAWAIALLAMLTSTLRLANRWAWFWMFTVGQVGAFLFLLLEPQPVWRHPRETPAARERMTGGRGCLFSILLAILAGFAAAGVGALIRLVLD